LGRKLKRRAQYGRGKKRTKGTAAGRFFLGTNEERGSWQKKRGEGYSEQKRQTNVLGKKKTG